MRATAAHRVHLLGCTWFWTWALVGVGLALGFLTLGILALVPAALVAAFLARGNRFNPFGLLSGIGVMLLVVAYIQRSGQSYDPVHWLVAGLLFFGAGLAGQAWRSR
jgi:galactitol-specific phosphotransferase system IIC component